MSNFSHANGRSKVRETPGAILQNWIISFHMSQNGIHTEEFEAVITEYDFSLSQSKGTYIYSVITNWKNFMIETTEILLNII